MQTDGNFVIYQNAASRAPIWATGTNGKGMTVPACYAAGRQSGGVWIVGGTLGQRTTKRGTAPFTLVMQDDGNLVVYDSAKRAVWVSNTQR